VAPSVQRHQVWLTPTTRVPCSNAANTRNPVEICWGAQNSPTGLSGPLVGRSSPYCEDMWRRYCCLTSFFRLSIHASVAKIQPDKIVQWSRMANFPSFCVLYFHRAACSTFQTCILNSHLGHTMCRSMVDIHSATAEIRRGKKTKEEETIGQKYHVRICYAGRP